MFPAIVPRHAADPAYKASGLIMILNSLANRKLLPLVAAFGFLAAFVWLSVGLVATPAVAESLASDVVTTPQTEARLVSAVTGGGDLAAIPLGLELRLQPGWKTYWRSPGDAAFPLTIDFQGSRNLAGADLAWPLPHRFQLFG